MITNETNTSLAREYSPIYSSEGDNKVQCIFSYLNHPDLNLQDFRTHIATAEEY